MLKGGSRGGAREKGWKEGLAPIYQLRPKKSASPSFPKKGRKKYLEETTARRNLLV